MREPKFISDVSELADAINSDDMRPLVLFGEIGIGKSPILKSIGGVLEIHKYGSSKDLIKEMILESLDLGFNQRKMRHIQHVFSIVDKQLFDEIKKSGLFRCFAVRRTSRGLVAERHE